MKPLFYYNRPTNMAYHDLTTHVSPPEARLLLGLKQVPSHSTLLPSGPASTLPPGSALIVWVCNAAKDSPPDQITIPRCMNPQDGCPPALTRFPGGPPTPGQL
jgi:hypothetical protein